MSCNPENITVENSIIYAKIISELESAGKAIDIRDVLIAEVVIENNASFSPRVRNIPAGIAEAF